MCRAIPTRPRTASSARRSSRQREPGHGSRITNHESRIIAQRRFLPYGGERYTEGTFPTDVGFTGQREHAGLGLVFMRARYYHPALGRFVSADTIVPEPGNPQALNRFAYVLGNPLAYVDPSGHVSSRPPMIEGMCAPGAYCPSATWAYDVQAAEAWMDSPSGLAYGRRWYGVYTSAGGPARWLHDTNRDIWDYSALAAEHYANEVEHLPVFNPGLDAAFGAALLTTVAKTIQIADLAAGPGQALSSNPAWVDIERAVNAGRGRDVSWWSPDTTARLQALADQAIQNVNNQGQAAYSRPQLRAMGANPNLRAAFQGSAYDREWKRLIALDPDLSHLQTARPFQRMPDVVDPKTGQWWDLTTSAQWQAHVTSLTMLSSNLRSGAYCGMSERMNLFPV